MSTTAPTKTITLTIDGKTVTTEAGTTVLQAALANGIYIPNLCHFNGTTPFAGCRLCLVEIEGADSPETSCVVPAKDGMVVRTDTPGVRQLQRQTLQLMLTEHPDRCLNCVRLERCPPFTICQRDLVVTDRCLLCPQNRQCELQRVVDFLGRPQQWVVGLRVSAPPERSNPYIERNHDYCIYCTRCVRICDEQWGIAAYGVAQPGSDPHIIVPWDVDLKDTNCTFCGACAIGCPVGAIVKHDTKYARPSDESVFSVCSYCGVGCSLQLRIEGGRVARVVPDPLSPAADGTLCVRGHFWYTFVNDERRLTAPLARTTSGNLFPASWEEILDGVTARMVEIRQKYGPEAIGFVSTGKSTNEEAYLLQRIAREVIGTENVDLASLGDKYAEVAGTVGERLGYPASTNSLSEIENSGCVLVVDADPAVTHPVLARRIWRAVYNGAKLIVINAEDTDLARFTHLYLRPRPGTAGILMNGILKVVLDSGWAAPQIGERVEGLQELQASLQKVDLARVAEVTGISVDDIQDAARMFSSGGRQGLADRPIPWHGSTAVEPRSAACTNNSCIVLGGEDTATANAAVNLSLVAGFIGVEGGGIMLMPPQNNTQGSIDMGLRPGLLPGYLPSERGKDYAEMLEAARQGTLKALFVLNGAPPAIEAGGFQPASLPLQAMLKQGCQPQGVPGLMEASEASRNLELLVVEDIAMNPTTEMADFVLAGAAFAEKDGTYTNLERRVQRIRPAATLPGDARPDWLVLATLGKKLQTAMGQESSFEYATAEAVMAEISQAAPIYSGLTYDRLGDRGLQWPAGEGILYQQGASPRKAQLTPAD